MIKIHFLLIWDKDILDGDVLMKSRARYEIMVDSSFSVKVKSGSYSLEYSTEDEHMKYVDQAYTDCGLPYDTREYFFSYEHPFFEKHLTKEEISIANHLYRQLQYRVNKIHEVVDDE